jgi:hypothetical protein
MFQEETVARKLKIQFGTRTRCNKLKWIYYKTLRVFYVSIYFYFEPFAVVLLSIFLPLLKEQTPTEKTLL